MESIISVANGTSSSIYGCISYAVQDIIMSKFPKDFFKYTSISTELAYRNMRRTFGGPNSRNEIAKRRKPYLIIQPTYSVMDSNEPMQNILLTTLYNDYQYGIDKGYLFPILSDVENGYNLKFKFNRERIEFDVRVVLSNLHTQIDTYRAILNNFTWGISLSNRLAMESIIPKDLVVIMSKCAGMDIEKHPEYIPMMIQRLNSCSQYPITYKIRNSSANDEWFMYYTHNVIMTYTDLNLDQGQRKNMVEESYEITFRVTAEFNLPGMYIIDGNMNNFKSLDLTLQSKSYDSENDTFIPIYAINNLFNRYPHERNGMSLYGTMMFKTEAEPHSLYDILELESIFDKDHVKAIRMHLAWNMKLESLLEIIILKNGTELTYDTDYKFDWNSFKLKIMSPDNSATYRIIIYVNYEQVNEILSNSQYENTYEINKPNENTITITEKDTESNDTNQSTVNDNSILKPNEFGKYVVDLSQSNADIHNEKVKDRLYTVNV